MFSSGFGSRGVDLEKNLVKKLFSASESSTTHSEESESPARHKWSKLFPPPPVFGLLRKNRRRLPGMGRSMAMVVTVMVREPTNKLAALGVDRYSEGSTLMIVLSNCSCLTILMWKSTLSSLEAQLPLINRKWFLSQPSSSLRIQGMLEDQVYYADHSSAKEISIDCAVGVHTLNIPKMHDDLMSIEFCEIYQNIPVVSPGVLRHSNLPYGGFSKWGYPKIIQP